MAEINMIAGIILAAGKGTRLKSKDKNKATLPFLNKPLIIYAVDLLTEIADPMIVVVGAFYKSVEEVLKDYKITYTFQKKRLGTGHATKVGLEELTKLATSPEIVLVSYGDHCMFYSKKIVVNLISLHRKENAVMSIITTHHEYPNSLAWGRVVRNRNGYIVDNIEQKDATADQLKIKEINAGFYCFNYKFLKGYINKISKSAISGEYYINSLIKIAADEGNKVAGLQVPFSGVGIGINRYDELEESQKLYLRNKT
ncbi:NTP transferase domain-containing protein [Candidatus Roizmanbacteria bacterium]|nr:NTP transferase domain-containing protein [Candidatus Roizmanbacteria bacterium]